MAERELPSGTVTFLFTDIEGSTRLLNRLGQHRYDDLLTAQQEIPPAATVRARMPSPPRTRRHR